MMFFTSLISVTQVEADDVLNKFTMTAVPSQKQYDKETSYFDLLIKPNEMEILKVDIENNSEENITLKASVNRAITNQNGVVEYSGENEESSESSIYNIEDIVSLKNDSLELAPGESKSLELTVQMPKQTFTGVIAGALYVIEEPETEAEGTIRNILSREIAILLRNDDKKIEPEVLIHSAKASHVNERNAIEIMIENISPTYIQDVTLTYEIKHEGELFLKDEKKNLKMAPSSMFPFVVPLEEKKFESGDYVVNVTVESEKNSWQEVLKFDVEKEEAKNLNDTDVSHDSTPSIPWSTVFLVLLLVFFIILVFYLIWKNNKLNRKIQSSKQKKKSSNKNKKR